jgi:DNA-binding PadR family transcriptional regulator
MSFNHHLNKAGNRQLPRGIRLSAFGSCVMHLDRLTGEGYGVTLERFQERFKIIATDSGERELSAALEAIKQEREEVLQKLRALEQVRKAEKQQGKRVPSKAQKESFHNRTYTSE